MPPEDEALPPAEFKVGDAVYYCGDENGYEIGFITDVTYNGAVWNYRIDYCQHKDMDRPRLGGNGSVFRPGFPKPVTKAADIIFVKGAAVSQRIKTLKRDLAYAEHDLAALKRAYALVQL